MFCNMTIDFGGVNYPKPYKDEGKQYVGFVAIFSGCSRAVRGHACPDCQNPSLWAFDTAPKFRLNSWSDFVSSKADRFKAVFDQATTEYFLAILGGEPLDQDPSELYSVFDSCMSVLGMKTKTALFTGYPDVGSIPETTRSFVRAAVDYLKVGPYLGNEHKKPDLPSGLATENQVWVNVPRLIAEGVM